MIVVKDLLDPYSRRARLQPALLAILPLALALLAWYPSEARTLGFVWAIVVSAGGTALLAQIARERGKRLEKELFDSWGGKTFNGPVATRGLSEQNNPGPTPQQTA